MLYAYGYLWPWTCRLHFDELLHLFPKLGHNWKAANCKATRTKLWASGFMWKTYEVPLTLNMPRYFSGHFVSSAWLCQQVSFVHPSSVRPSVNSGFSESATWTQTKSWKTTYPPYLQTFLFLQYFFFFFFFWFHKILRLFFCSFSLTWSQNVTALLLPQFRSDFNRTLW